MQVEISCEIYSRMSEIPLCLADGDQRKYFRSIYIERHNQQLFLVVTNGALAAIEHIGPNDGPDERTAIAIDQALIDQCQREVQYNSNLVIVANDVLSYTTIKTTFGYNHPGNMMVTLPANNHFDNWRKWAPDEMPTKNKGAMFWASALINALAIASPTGGICFPEFIDVTKPVVVRDKDSANWFGLFMPTTDDGDKIEPATVPDWAS